MKKWLLLLNEDIIISNIQWKWDQWRYCNDNIIIIIN